LRNLFLLDRELHIFSISGQSASQSVAFKTFQILLIDAAAAADGHLKCRELIAIGRSVGLNYVSKITIA
jgi:hypothetical protein